MWLDSIETNVDQVELEIKPWGGQTIIFTVTASAIIVSDLSISYAGIVVVIFTAPSDFPSWYNIDLNYSYLRVKNSSTNRVLLEANLRFLNTIGIQFSANDEVTIPLIFPPLQFKDVVLF